MDFNVFHGPKISWYSPWFIPPGELWIEKKLKDETNFLIKSEFLEKNLYKNFGDYWRARRKTAEILCKKGAGNFVTKKFKKGRQIIKIVDGEIVRKVFDPSFVAGGHGLIYPWYIPKNEIWLDGKFDPKELKYILAHEESEYRLMLRGWNYNEAHKKACVIEKELRAKDGVAFYPKKNPIAPLHFIKIGRGPKRILITSGIHGDERSGPYALIKFLLGRKNLRNLNADVVPLINPTGFKKRTRKDANGKDLNRWFFDKTRKGEPKECRILKNFTRKIKRPYELLVSLHEDPDRKEFYLYSTGFSQESAIIRKIFNCVKKSGVILYTGMDTTDPRDLTKNFVENGYASVEWNDPAPTFEEYLSRRRKVKKVITLEIPGKLLLDKKINLVIEILERVLFITKP